jgi:hypothetical protein
MDDKQKIYIYMDDSGKMSHTEKCCSYGGIYFKNRNNRDEFKRHYTDIINENKCNFCKNDSKTCLKDCPEIKSNNTNTKFRRRIVNLIKNSTFANSFATTIYNKDIPIDVLNIKHSRGRRTDYYQKRIIKEIVKKLISDKDIDPNKYVELEIRIDECPQATNGLYGLQESIVEELLYGITNYDYARTFSPILFGGLKVNLKYVDSKKEALVQASDFFVGYVNATHLWKPKKEELSFVDVQLFF